MNWINSPASRRSTADEGEEGMTCSTCRYWKAGNAYLDQTLDGEPTKGECRRRAPGNASDWPVTAREDWCGEFEGKETKGARGGRKPLSEAPTDGTPILFHYPDEPSDDERPIIIAYGDFESGFCSVEKCSGGFYSINAWDDFIALASYPGEWEAVPPDVAAWLRKNLSF